MRDNQLDALPRNALVNRTDNFLLIQPQRQHQRRKVLLLLHFRNDVV
jgi:hypothetical protein